MGQRLKQFLLLLWKNFLIQKRKVVMTIFEIGLPAFFALILIFIRLRVVGEMQENKQWVPCDHWDRLHWTLPQKMAFAPQSNATQRVMEDVYTQLRLKGDLKGFNTEEEMVDFLMFANSTVNNTREYLGGVVFSNDSTKDGGDTFAKHVTYKLRLSSSPRNADSTKLHLNPFLGDTSWGTQFTFPLFQRVGPREPNKTCGGAPGYVREGFLAIQNAVSMAVLQEFDQLNSSLLPELNLKLQRHPYPAFDDDNFIIVIQNQFPLILLLSFVLVSLNIVKDVVHEKERKLKESMKMMGLNNWLHWLAWFVKYVLFLLITVAIMTLFFCINTHRGPVIGTTDPSVLFVFLILYSISTICFCFAVSVFFSRANSGAAAGGILFFITYIPYFFLQPRYQTLTFGQKILSSLLSNVAMAYGGQVIGMYEGTGAGVQWKNIMTPVSVDDNFTMFDVMLMLVVDSFLYLLIMWYVEAVFPGEYGVPQKWYFPFTCSYWYGTTQDDFVSDDKRFSVGQNQDYFESDPMGLKAGIRIRNLKKTFKSGEGKKIAVAGMTLDMYEGQITALLGHNGAGKTTTMSMLTGFIPATSGTAYVNGYDIRKDIANVRSSLGLCPQHDVLFDTLTVEEHLIFFAKLKGCPSSDIKSEIDDMLTAINLQNKRHDLSKSLSGGMKRKLSVGIALIGGSRIVILDEPSSGMDPDARRQLWTVLQNNRKGRTMVLTTHFMDEADHLGDRIAIMADGMVKCCGSSLFLKNKYGAGYHMIIVKEPDCDASLLTSVVQKHVPDAKLEHNVGAELSYILPHEMSSKFEHMFRELEDNKRDLGIASYGASVTTMEEVFLRVGEASESVQGKKIGDSENSVNSHPRNHEGIKIGSRDKSVNNDPRNSEGEESVPTTVVTPHPSMYSRSASFTQDIVRNTGTVLLLQQFYAMFVKRALHTLRNIKVTVTQLGVPLFFTIAALVVLKTYPGPHDSQPLNLTVNSFGDNNVVLALASNTSVLADGLRKTYMDQFDKDPMTQAILVNNETGFKKDPDIMKYLLKIGHDSIGEYNLNYLIAANIDPWEDLDTPRINVTAFFNNQAFHSPAISVATVANALMKFVANSSKVSMKVINHPLPRTAYDRVRDELKSDTTGFTVAFNIVFGMAFLASSFTLFLIKERAVKAKHLQFTSGSKFFTFWMATFFWDMINYLMPCVCLLVTFWGFNVDAYVKSDHLGHIALLFLLYGFAMLPFMYLLSFFFTVPSTGFVWLTMFNILSGVATILAVGILSIPQLGLRNLSQALEWVFLVLLPNYCLGQGLEDYYSNFRFKPIYEEFCVALNFKSKSTCQISPNFCCRDSTGNCGDDFGCLDFNENPLGWESNGIGRMLVFLIVQSVLYFTILFLLESQVAHRLLQCLVTKSESPEELVSSSDSATQVQEDDDVAKERTRLASSSLENLFQSKKLLINELSKFYGNNLAVNRISVGIPKGECFGLLGVNGAGKTTTFKMLTGDETVSSGTAYLNGHSIKTEIAEVRQDLGYCPQFDALIDQMSGRETLYMYARLRGIRSSQIAQVVDDLIEALLLRPHADKLVQAYSGGNKRKLSTAIALIGNPPVVFLDEPTTGMDPMARRFLWDTLCQIRSTGRTLILTSHSMEECEALCTRIAVMVNGQFKCLGSPQHLKNKFGEGYTLLARVSPRAEEVIPDPKPLMEFIENKFPGCILKDLHQGMVHYHITDVTLKWADIFGIMERAKKDFGIEDYSVSQTTLEQVFINFARAQVPPQELDNGCCGGVCFPCRLCSRCCSRSINNYEVFENEPESRYQDDNVI